MLKKVSLFIAGVFLAGLVLNGCVLDAGSSSSAGGGSSSTASSSAPTNEMPVAAISSPTNGSDLVTGYPVTVSASAIDDYALSNLVVIINGVSNVKPASGTSALFSTNFSAASGPLVVVAYALDTNGVLSAAKTNSNMVYTPQASTVDTWVNGTISAGGKGWYSMNVLSNQLYLFYSSDGFNGTNSLNAKWWLFQNNMAWWNWWWGFDLYNHGWVYTFQSNWTVLLKVEGVGALDSGTYGFMLMPTTTNTVRIIVDDTANTNATMTFCGTMWGSTYKAYSTDAYGDVIASNYTMFDDGVHDDGVAGNHIWGFDVVLLTNETYTVKFCPNTGNQWVGGTDIKVLPATATFWYTNPPTHLAADIVVKFSVSMSNVTGVTSLGIRGNATFSNVLSWGANNVTLYDDGTHGDAGDGDNVYTAYVTFPAGSISYVEYKYNKDNGSGWENDRPNRNFIINPSQLTNVLPTAVWDK